MVCQLHVILVAFYYIKLEAHGLVAPCAVGGKSLAVHLERERTGVLHADNSLA